MNNRNFNLEDRPSLRQLIDRARTLDLFVSKVLYVAPYAETHNQRELTTFNDRCFEELQNYS